MTTDKKKNRHRNRRKPRNAPPRRPSISIQGPPKTPLHGAFKTLMPELQHAVAAEGYTTPTRIQEQAMAPILAGRDLLGCAQTGTGKTAAFALPILQRLADDPPGPNQQRKIRALILSPTRELAHQISDNVKIYGRHLRLFHATLYGGVGVGPQIQNLKRGVDLIIATPGRLIDLLQQGHIDLRAVEYFVLDEADRMMDMGFIADIRKIIGKLPKHRQNLLFSATMPPNIRELARSLQKDPVEIQIEPEKPSVDAIAQSVYLAPRENKVDLLKALLENPAMHRAIVFTRTKRRADTLGRKLERAGYTADIIHSGKSQNRREKTINRFREGKTRILVASDVVSRGIDVDNISHVVNFDMPEDPETYVHRIGRTGRAGARGEALSFCAHEEHKLLKDIEHHLKKPIPCVEDHDFLVPKSVSPNRQPDPRNTSSKQKQKQKPKGEAFSPIRKRRRKKPKRQPADAVHH
ncbi:MAG: DEAD/DEAH box helicase [Verrucomicrobiota bacterium]